MIKKLLIIFRRDLKSSMRDAMATYIIVVPVILAIVITLFAPGLNDTTVNIAMLKSDKTDHIEYMQGFAKVELFSDMNELERRVNRRDDMAAIVPRGDGYEILLQGNESEVIELYTVMLNSLYELGTSKEDTTATMLSFGRTVPPLKSKLVNMLISMTIMLAGMLIAISIVQEKTDNTINALNVTPISQTGFVIGKSIMGGVVAMIGIIAGLLITGFYNINWFMIILVGLTSLILTIVIGFVQGLASDDVIEAAANVKMILLPIAGSIAGYEFLSDKWQWTMFWSPFYWAYKANNMILSRTADWGTVLLCTALVFALSMAMYFISLPKIRKGLS
ncbi:MAG: ABC transporter permease [Spirochaetales bacterium]|jgi:ABC-2 type transport system permease protein|nr:ABC transporter permease [Spirochaetales bacterium]